MSAWCAIISCAAAVLTIAIASTPAPAVEGDASGCTIETREQRTVTRVIDGETFIVDGGSEVRLAGILAPKAFDTAGGASSWPLADEARQALETLIAGRAVALAFAGPRTDRHGRLVAHVFTANIAGAGETWVQGGLLQRGLARAYAIEPAAPCVAAMIAQERLARDVARGLWTEAAYAIRAADDVNTLLRLTGTFQIVEGRVSAVSDARGTTYVNFGEDWRQDFTVVIRQPMRRALTTSNVALEGLTGTIVRVHGWIERRGGPMIDLSHVGLLQVIPDGATAPAERTSRRRARRAAGP